jgi:redox-sensing transcriptional repressor
MQPDIHNIPQKTVERLSEYRRTLARCDDEGITHIYSHVLAAIHGLTAVQVRRDLMLIGFTSNSKRGYEVKVLSAFISKILDSPSPLNIAVIGMGHVGHAITQFFNHQSGSLRMVAAFEVDPAKVGQTLCGIPCFPIDKFGETVARLGISMVMLAVPSRAAESFVGPIIEAGIKGVFNFTSVPLSFPRGIFVETFDVTTALEKLAYQVKESERLGL